MSPLRSAARLLALPLAPALLFACSAPDRDRLSTHAYAPAPSATSPDPGAHPGSNTPPAEPGDDPTPPRADAGAPAPLPATDAAAPSTPDAAPKPPPATAPPGTCKNPLCGAFDGYCGCTATDSNGNEVQLGCEPGGQCGCFTNHQLDDGTVTPENGVCAQGSMAEAQLFIQQCTCN